MVMANRNAAFGTIADVSRDKDGVAVTLADGQSLRAALAYASLLEELRRRNMPAYFETDAEARAITRVRIADVVRVERISANSVTFENSHARATVKDDSLLSTLRNAAETKQWLAVTIADNFQVLDARSFAAPPLEAVPEAPLTPAKAWSLFWWRNCVSKKRAQQLFDLCGATTCNPTTIPPPCIPFLYPDDGCWGRAHEMARLMIAAGAKPRKVWIYGTLHTLTKNNPNCFVDWGWHVAPTLCVRICWWFPFWTQEQVIDPSLFKAPVSKAKWKSVQGDPNATFVSTSADIFSRFFGSEQTDPAYTQTNIVLAKYRLKLQARSLSLVGPPPYNCP